MNVTACKSGKSGTEERGHSLGRPRTDNGNDSTNTEIFLPLKCTVVFLLATPPALTPLSTYSATHARQNTVIHRAEAWRGGGKSGGWAEKPCLKNYSLGKKLYQLVYVFLKPLASTFELDLVHFGRNLNSSPTGRSEIAFKCETLPINHFEKLRSNMGMK